MTTPGSQARQTAADSGPGPGPADRDGAPGLARPYTDPARRKGVDEGHPGVNEGSPEYGYSDPGGGGADFAYDTPLPPGWPGSPEPAAEDPADGGAEAGDFPPGSTGPASADPAATDPASAELASVELTTSEPSPDPAAADWASTDWASASANLRGANRAVADPAGTQPSGNQPSGNQPSGNQPAGNQPAGNQPPGNQPPGTEPPGAEPADTGPAGAELPGASIVRSSGIMAVGTIASRVTGFLRTAILIYAVGTHDLGNAYQIANTVPNAVYNLALGGVLTSVVVPLLVSAAKRNQDRGEAYDQRIFTLGVLTLAGITVVATALAAPIIDLYGHGLASAPTHHLAVIFAYFFLPQIFFYGVSSLAGAILNARGRFGAPMWTPVINNVVVIMIGLLFMLTAGLNRTPQDISGAEIELLGIGTTLGIILQTAALIPSLRGVGFRWRPRFDFRRSEVSEIGRMGGWMFGYVLTTQVSFLITAVVANTAGARVSQQAAGAGYAAYSNAWQLFQLPYAIVGISVITAMLPRMSSHAAARDYRLVSADFSTAARLASVIVVPCAVVLAVLGAPLAVALFGWGSTSVASAHYLGVIFAVFSLGLLPYMLFQLQLRVFYAMHDSRTPALIGLAAMAMNIAANYVALAVLPAREVVAGLGVGFGLANLLGAVLAWIVLSRRLGGLDGANVSSTLLRMHASAIPPTIFAIAISLMIGVVLPNGKLGAFVTIVLAGAGGLLLYVMFAKAFRVRELTDLTESVTGRFRR
jgi:putative peptidoglycan lipid II flippase